MCNGNVSVRRGEENEELVMACLKYNDTSRLKNEDKHENRRERERSRMQMEEQEAEGLREREREREGG